MSSPSSKGGRPAGLRRARRRYARNPEQKVCARCRRFLPIGHKDHYHGACRWQVCKDRMAIAAETDERWRGGMILDLMRAYFSK